MLSSSEKGVEEVTTTKFHGYILRSHFSAPANLSVWVQAKNQNDSANSRVVVFNTRDICKEEIHCHSNTMPFLSDEFNNILLKSGLIGGFLVV